MTDTPTTPEKATKNTSFIIPALLAILAIAAIGYVAATRTGIDKKMVEASLAVWGENLAAYGKTQGEEITFAYDAVEMQGEAASRHAIVKNPHIIIQSKVENTFDDAGEKIVVHNTRISTASIVLQPESVSMKKLKVTAPDPIEVSVDDASSGRILSSVPLVIAVEQTEEKNVQWIDSALLLAPEMTFESPDSADTLIVKTEAGSSLSGKVSANFEVIDHAAIALNKLLITDVKSQQFLTASSIALQTQNQQQEDGTYHVAIHGQISDLLTTEEEMPYGAVNALLDVGYKGPLPKEGESLDWSTTQSELNIAKMNLSGKDTSVDVAGKFTTGSGELLPIGSVHLNVKNFAFIRDEMKKHEMFAKKDENVVAILLAKMTGTPMDEISDLDLDITREKGASLKLGKMTFEEGMAIVLTGGKLTPPPAATTPKVVPAAPVAPAPVVQ